MHGKKFGCVRMKNGAFEAKGNKLEIVTSRHITHDSPQGEMVTSRHNDSVCKGCNFSAFEQFSYFSHNFGYRCPNWMIQVAMER